MNSIELAKLSANIPDPNSGASIDSGFNMSFASDVSRFEASLERVGAPSNESTGMEVAKAALSPFENLNVEASELAEFAANASADGDGFTPSEIVTLTYKAQEFGFHSQLTANVANRMADGLQQLFRQQG